MIDNSEISIMNTLNEILYLHNLILDRINNLRQPREDNNIPNAW